jgi:hypothetical protein
MNFPRHQAHPNASAPECQHNDAIAQAGCAAVIAKEEIQTQGQAPAIAADGLVSTAPIVNYPTGPNPVHPATGAGMMVSAVPQQTAPGRGIAAEECRSITIAEALESSSLGTASAITAEAQIPSDPATQISEAPLGEEGSSATIAGPPGNSSRLAYGTAKASEPPQVEAARMEGNRQDRFVATASATTAEALAPGRCTTQPARMLPKASPEDPGSASIVPAAAIISVLQEMQNRVLQTLQSHRGGSEVMADEQSLAPRTEPSFRVVDTAAPEPRSASADPPTEAPPLAAPPTLEDRLAVAVQQLIGLQPAPAYVKRLQDSVDDAELLLDCLQGMLARGELYEGGNLLYSRILYLCGQRDGLFQSPFRTERRAEQDDRRRPK